MPRWLSDTAAPAWVQAVGTIVAILIAVLVPWWQRRNVLKDAATDRALREKEHLRRLTAGLREEIRAASDAATRRESAIKCTLAKLEKALKGGAVLKETGPIQPGSLSLTDGTIYRQIASELGRLPPELIKAVVSFYAGALEIDRISNSAPTALQAYQSVLPMLPRAKTYAAIVVRTLDKFEASDFATDADIRPTPQEVRDFSVAAGYPLDDIARERGITLPR
jgi:heme exporter protein D